MMRISNIVHKKLVFLDLEANSKSLVFEELVRRLVKSGFLRKKDQPDLYGKLNQRETIASTAVGQGIAIPHAYIDQVNDPLLMFARLPNPIDFDAEDGKLVDKVFILVGPKRDNTEHLRILARLSRLLRDEDFYQRLDEIKTPIEFVEAVNFVENRH